MEEAAQAVPCTEVLEREASSSSFRIMWGSVRSDWSLGCARAF